MSAAVSPFNQVLIGKASDLEKRRRDRRNEKQDRRKDRRKDRRR